MKQFRAWTALAVLHFAVAVAGCGQDRVQKGWRLYREGDPEGARAAFTEAAKKTPAEAALALGELEYNLSNYQAAAQHFAQAVSDNDKDPLAYAWYGAAVWRWKPDETALQAFLRAIELAPEGDHVSLIAGTVGDAYETTRWTAGEVDSHSPTFAPDGKSVIFTRHQDGSGELFRLDFDARQMEPLVAMPTTNEYGANFSPDGKRLLFASEQHRTDAAILNLQASGSTPRSEMFYVLDLATKQTTPLLTSPASVGNPVFTPDGKRILFESAADENLDVWAMNADGSNRQRLTTAKEDDGRPVPTPDGKLVVFVEAHEGNFDLMTMNPDGTGTEQVTKTPANEFGGVFSPDGSRYYMPRSEGSGYQIVAMDWATRRIRPLSGGVGDSLHPAMSPDGKRLAFASNRSDYLEVYVMDLTKPVSSETLKRRIQASLGTRSGS